MANSWLLSLGSNVVVQEFGSPDDQLTRHHNGKPLNERRPPFRICRPPSLPNLCQDCLQPMNLGRNPTLNLLHLHLAR